MKNHTMPGISHRAADLDLTTARSYPHSPELFDCQRHLKTDPKLRIFCLIRTYLAAAARHGISALDALTRAAQGEPWIPDTG
jgi:hypothetical protein